MNLLSRMCRNGLRKKKYVVFDWFDEISLIQF